MFNNYLQYKGWFSFEKKNFVPDKISKDQNIYKIHY